MCGAAVEGELMDRGRSWGTIERLANDRTAWKLELNFAAAQNANRRKGSKYSVCTGYQEISH